VYNVPLLNSNILGNFSQGFRFNVEPSWFLWKGSIHHKRFVILEKFVCVIVGLFSQLYRLFVRGPMGMKTANIS
jgi:hypothetical protein